MIKFGAYVRRENVGNRARYELLRLDLDTFIDLNVEQNVKERFGVPITYPTIAVEVVWKAPLDWMTYEAAKKFLATYETTNAEKIRLSKLLRDEPINQI